jgi:hypothetical protein
VTQEVQAPALALERKALLTLYADGEILIPNARTYGDVLALMDVVTRQAQALRERLFNMPLQATGDDVL